MKYMKYNIGMSTNVTKICLDKVLLPLSLIVNYFRHLSTVQYFIK